MKQISVWDATQKFDSRAGTACCTVWGCWVAMHVPFVYKCAKCCMVGVHIHSVCVCVFVFIFVCWVILWILRSEKWRMWRVICTSDFVWNSCGTRQKPRMFKQTFGDNALWVSLTYDWFKLFKKTDVSWWQCMFWSSFHQFSSVTMWLKLVQPSLKIVGGQSTVFFLL